MCFALKLPDVSQESDHRVPIPHHNLLRTKLPGCLQQQRSEDCSVVSPCFESVWISICHAAAAFFLFFNVCVLFLHRKAELFCSSFIIYVFGGAEGAPISAVSVTTVPLAFLMRLILILWKPAPHAAAWSAKTEEQRISKGGWVISEPLWSRPTNDEGTAGGSLWLICEYVLNWSVCINASAFSCALQPENIREPRLFVFSDLCLGCHRHWEMARVGRAVSTADYLHVASFLLM